MNRWYELAEQVADKSEYPRINIGAVIVLGNYAVASGFNQQKSHPRQAALNEKYSEFDSSHFLHAEVHALIQSGRTDIRGGDIYVFRRNKVGELANSRPCPSCYGAIKEAGISRIYYTSTDGYWYEEVK